MSEVRVIVDKSDLEEVEELLSEVGIMYTTQDN